MDDELSAAFSLVDELREFPPPCRGVLNGVRRGMLEGALAFGVLAENENGRAVVGVSGGNGEILFRRGVGKGIPL
jgi:hypothetical protein